MPSAFDDDVDQFVPDDDDLGRFLACHPLDDLGKGERLLPECGFVGARCHDQAFAYPAVDLDDDFLFLVEGELFVVDGPGNPGDALRMAEPRPELLAQVGGVGREHEDEWFPQ